MVVHEVNNKFSLVLSMSPTRNLITRCLRDIDLIDCKSVPGIRGKNIVCSVQRVGSQVLTCVAVFFGIEANLNRKRKRAEVSEVLHPLVMP